MGRKQLYESVQLLENRIVQQQKIIEGLTTRFARETSTINSSIVNSCTYAEVLRIHDAIQASNVIITEIPETYLPSNRLEFMWYLYGSLCFFREDDRVLITSYSKTGALNGLGDLTEVQPIDFAGKTHGIERTVVYNDNLVSNPCVIINDYTGAYTENQIFPRCAVNSVSINDQAYVYKKMRDSIMLTAKKAIALVENETMRQQAEKSLAEFYANDSPIASMVGKSIGEVAKLFNLDTKLDIENYLRAIEAYERPRANFNGIPTRSSLDKKERLISSEAENDNALTNVYLYDRLLNRQIGIELMKKHAICKEGSARINEKVFPKNDPEKEGKEKKGNESKKVDGNGGEE